MGKNYSIGCIGEIYQRLDYKDGLKRPNAVRMSHGLHVEPKSLYRQQLNNRDGKTRELRTELAKDAISLTLAILER